jgi:AsmA protein
VRIENGSISYREGAIVRSIDELNLTVVLPSMDDPVSFDGSMNLDGFPTRFDAELQSLRGFFEGQRTDIAFNITGALADIAFSGHFLESEDVSLDGGIDLTLAVRALSRYLGTDLPEGDTFRHFKADSDIAIRPGQVSLSNGVIEFDDTVANEGTLVLDYDRVRPLVTGNLNVEQLDLTPYLPASAQSVETEGDATIPPWSEEEMDLSPLRAIDADLSFTAAAFRARDIEAENVDITARLENGRLVSTLSDFGLYSGIGNLVAVVNARNARPSYSLRAIMDGLDALPFLGAAAQFDLLKGLGSVNLDLTASGASQAAIMNSLSGTGSFDFSEGAIVGVNLAQVIRTIQQAVTTGSLPSGFATEEETDFSSLTGTLQISNGVADNLDLSMLSPLLRVAGTGRVNLAEQSLDYLLTPRAVTALTGQGGELDLNGLEIPIRLVGDFNNVGIEIDYGAVAQSLLRAEAGDLIVGDLGDALGRGQSLEDAAGDALRNFLGGSDDEEDEEADPAQQLLRGLLGSGRDNDDDDEDDSDNR